MNTYFCMTVANSAEEYQKAMTLSALTYNSDDDGACRVAGTGIIASTRVSSGIGHLRVANDECGPVALIRRIRHRYPRCRRTDDDSRMELAGIERAGRCGGRQTVEKPRRWHVMR